MNEIKSEYFELLKILNKSNKVKNEITKLSFYVDASNSQNLKLYAALSIDQKILLCEKKGRSKWRSTNTSQFSDLDKFIAKNADDYYLLNFSEIILARIFELPD